MNDFAQTILTINLSAIANNYCVLQEQSGVRVAAVVKANAYGLGVMEVASALKGAGCDYFFVANLDEAIELRNILPDVSIAVFHGVVLGQESVFVENNLIPVLNTKEQISNFSSEYPCIIHVDTGMNRLGVSVVEAMQMKQVIDNLQVDYIMSHLACADVKDHSLNAQQLGQVLDLKKAFVDIPISFANSYGVFLGSEYHFDMVRPGMALYGVNPCVGEENPMQYVVMLTSEVLQIRQIDTLAAVGYGATYTLENGGVLATVPVGYADGYFRSLSNVGSCIVAGNKVPIVGRVSMDLIVVDVSSLNLGEVQVGSKVELLGEAITVDEVAEAAGTIGYEVLTNLGSRYKRCYVN